MRKSCEIELEPRGAQTPARPIDAAICMALSYSVLERERLLAPSVVREMVFELQTRIAVVHLTSCSHMYSLFSVVYSLQIINPIHVPAGEREH